MGCDEDTWDCGDGGIMATEQDINVTISSGNDITVTLAYSCGVDGTSGSSGTSFTAATAYYADTAAYATSAGRAGTALYATSSGNAGGLSTGGTADYSLTSGTAAFATSAGNAGLASSASFAGTAQAVIGGGAATSGTADFAHSAGTAVFASSAAYAGKSGTADYAVLSGTSSYATSAGKSGTSDYSTLSGTANYATSSGQSGTALIAGTASFSSSAGAAGTALFATSAGNAGTALFAQSIGTDGTFNSLRVTGSQTNGTVGYVVNTYWGTAATMDTTGVPLGSLYIQTGAASSSDYAGTSDYATSAGQSGTALYATSSGNSGTALYATSAGQAGTAVKATSAGYCGTAQVFLAPYANLSCGSSMTANTSALSAFYDSNDLLSGITHTTAGTSGEPGYAERIQIDTAGTYLITWSAIAKSSNPGETLEIWFAVNGVNVSKSNTKNTFVGNNAERLITVTFLYTFTAGQYFELKYRASATTVSFVATGTAAAPDRPSSPSIIVTVNRIA